MTDREENVKAWKRLKELDPEAAQFAADVAKYFDVDSFIYVSGKRKKKLEEETPAPLVKVTLLGKPIPEPGDEYEFQPPFVK